MQRAELIPLARTQRDLLDRSGPRTIPPAPLRHGLSPAGMTDEQVLQRSGSDVVHVGTRRMEKFVDEIEHIGVVADCPRSCTNLIPTTDLTSAATRSSRDP